jgi:hypothetical protein
MISVMKAGLTHGLLDVRLRAQRRHERHVGVLREQGDAERDLIGV